MNADRRTCDPDGDAAEGPHSEPRHVIETDDAAADVVRRVQLHQRLRHGVERQLEEAGKEQQHDRNGIDPQPSSATLQSIASQIAVRGVPLRRPQDSSAMAASTAPAASAASSTL